MSVSAVAGSPAAGRGLVLLPLFVGSGCAALVYEVVWFELLREIIGASSVSLAILLASFMAGMCLGSIGFSRWVPRRWHPLHIYAVLELGIAVVGVALLLVLPLVRHLYVAVVGYGLPGILLRALVCAVALLPPTVLMGATLPAVARWMESTRTGISHLGLLYMANLAGAVAGCLLAGFYLLRVHDMVVATLFAALVNVVVAGVALLLARRTGLGAVFAGGTWAAGTRVAGLAPSTGATGIEADPAGGAAVLRRRRVYLVIGLSGLTALGAEVVWTRLLGLLMGATVYTFSIILAVFLVGLGLGSSGGSWLARHSPRPARALAWSQLLLVAAIPLGAFMINQEIPFWYLNPAFADSLVPRYFHDLLRAAVAMLPATVLWGASFPLALAAATGGDDAPDRLVGDVYAANTLGAIAGALAFGMVMIPWLGTWRSQQYLVILAGLSALLMFEAAASGAGEPTAGRVGGRPGAGDDAAGGSGADGAGDDAASGSRPDGAGSDGPTAGRARAPWGLLEAGRAVAVLGLAALASWTMPATASGLIAYGRYVEEWDRVDAYHYVGEGRSTSVAVSDYQGGDTRSMHVGGKVVASNKPIDMRIERLLGHVPGLVHPAPRTVLVVGFGAGVTAGSFVDYPEVERIVICEIEPLVPASAGVWFRDENRDVVSDPRVEIVYDDARHFIATTQERFDVITSDPIHPWVRGAASLYTREYFDLVKRRLEPGGVVAQWVPLYETDEATVKTEMATFLEAFPDGTVWNSDIHGEGYDVVMLGQLGPTVIDVAALGRRLTANPAVQRSLAEVDLPTAAHLLSTYLGQGRDLGSWLEGTEINRDRSLRLQYLAGLSLDRWDTEDIFAAIARHRQYPANVFVAPPALEMELRRHF